MRRDRLFLLARHVLSNAFRNKAIVLLLGIVVLLLVYATYSGATVFQQQTQSRVAYQKQVRDNWEKMPDKHPHRMAHYGYIVFRPKHTLSLFDVGMESYTGNSIFLEAHRQNSTNFSEAGFSTGMLRFGEISMAMVLQVLVPLVIFFIGFSTIAADKENGTLKILLSQGATWKEILAGKAIGLLGIALPVLLLSVLLLWIATLLTPAATLTYTDLFRMLGMVLFYTLYFGIVCMFTVLISAISKKAKVALVLLTGAWLLSAIIIPRTTQALGNFIYPTPSRIAFETNIEKELLKKGDSHNPNDPYYKALKDSVLKANQVEDVKQLPFNYSGFQMKEGERLSATIYQEQLKDLLVIYQRQNNISRTAAFVNPFSAIRQVSMAFCGTDFSAYTRFQQQAEDYRYKLAQQMNDLQIKLISNEKPGEHDRPLQIDHEHWKAFPDFQYLPTSAADAVSQEKLSLIALLCWTLLLLGLLSFLSKKLKAI